MKVPAKSQDELIQYTKSVQKLSALMIDDSVHDDSMNEPRPRTQIIVVGYMYTY